MSDFHDLQPQAYPKNKMKLMMLIAAAAISLSGGVHARASDDPRACSLLERYRDSYSGAMERCKDDLVS